MDPIFRWIMMIAVALPLIGFADVYVGVGRTEITPPIGTPSAGYAGRWGAGMQGVHDPLYAIALYIDNGEKQIVFCSVDHLGFTYEMVQAVVQKVHSVPQLDGCQIYIGSSHTHSGGGAYLNIPFVGSLIAGAYQSEIVQFYIDQTAQAIIQAGMEPISAKIGIGYGKAEPLGQYRGQFPPDIEPLSDVTVIKVTTMDDKPLAVLFNYALHPTVLNADNRQFSADFVGYARDELQKRLGEGVQAIYFNGAQGDIIPLIDLSKERFTSCELLGCSLAQTVWNVWNDIVAYNMTDIQTVKETYTFQPQATLFGFCLPINEYKTEINAIVMNRQQAFITIPGELSVTYDRALKAYGKAIGYENISILGLTNDAHGYIISPESWKGKTSEARLSFGGEYYGEWVKDHVQALLRALLEEK